MDLSTYLGQTFRSECKYDRAVQMPQSSDQVNDKDVQRLADREQDQVLAVCKQDDWSKDGVLLVAHLAQLVILLANLKVDDLKYFPDDEAANEECVDRRDQQDADRGPLVVWQVT